MLRSNGLPTPARRVAWWLLAVYSALHLGYSLLRYNPFVSPSSSRDFWRVYTEAEQWRMTGIFNLDNVLHPPLYYVLLRPLTQLGFETTVALLYWSQFIWYALAIVWLTQAAARSSHPPLWQYGLVTALVVNFQPFLETLASHKVEGIECALIALALYLLRKGRDGWAGAAIVLAANLKYLPGVLAVYFLLTRQRRVMMGMALATFVCLGILLVAHGPQQFVRLCLQYPMVLMFGHQHEGNVGGASIEFQTLSGTINRWLVGGEGMRMHFRTQAYAMVPDAPVAFAIAAAVKWLLVAGYLWFVLRRRTTGPDPQARWGRVLCEVAVTLVMAFVIAQPSRVHYAVVALPGFVWLGLWLAQDPAARRVEWVLWGVAYALTAMVIPGGVLNRLPPSPWWGPYHSFAYLWFSLPFFGLVALAASSILCAHRLRRSSTARSVP